MNRNRSKARKSALIIFTRIPIPEQTKTRLMPFFNGAQCARLHQAMIRDVCTACQQVDMDIFVFYTPEGRKEILLQLLEDLPAVYSVQIGENLGERMHQAFCEVFRLGYEKAVLVGTDIPLLTASVLQQAFYQLENHDVILHPTEDGGYYLIGMKEPHPEIWNISAYGKRTVLEETCKLLETNGLKMGFGAILSDVDTKEDLLKLYGQIKSDASTSAVYTKKYLQEIFPLQINGSVVPDEE